MRIYEEWRERLRGRSNPDYANFVSMVLIASKYDLDPKHLVDAFFEAWKRKNSHCGGLKIACREVNQDSAVFLITKGEKVVWQFPVNLASIRNSEARDYIKEILIPKKRKYR